MRTLLPSLILAAASFASALAPAQAPEAITARLRADTLASHCAACHGTAGRAIPRTVVPGLAGRPSGELLELLLAYKQDRLGATVMHQIAKGYTDAQLEQIAAWFAAQPGSASPTSQR